MKFARLVCTAIALTLVTGWATWSYACDQDKTSAASAKSKGVKVSAAYVSATKASGTCTAGMAAHCTPEMAAACKASMTSAANAKGMTFDAVTASTAAPASAHDGCCMGKASASAASAGGSCAMKGASAVAASSNGSCAMKGASAAAGQCNGHGMGAMASATAHSDCEACIDGWDCNEALDAAGAHRQAVRLKNGVMYVYTADSQGQVSAVQAAVARRGDHMARLAAAGDKAHLCAECKSMRGAMASGKLTREVVNIEGGSLTLITSTDPAVVAKIHAMADTKVAARTKS